MLMRFLFILFSIFLIAGIAHADPFFGGGSPPPPEHGMALWDSLMRWVESWQAVLSRRLQELLASALNDKLEEFLPHAFALSFLYGVLHALGPGHAKTVIASYFLTQPGSAKRILAASLHVAVAHVASAVVIVCLLYFLLQKSFGEFGGETYWISVSCYGLIVALGCWMLFKQVKRILRTAKHGHEEGGECCAHHHHEKDEHAHQVASMRILSWTAGMVPCPGPILAMLFMAANDRLGLGIALASAMALGMAATVFSVALAAGMMRKAMLGGSGLFGENAYRYVLHGLGLLGALLVIALGGLLLLASL